MAKTQKVSVALETNALVAAKKAAAADAPAKKAAAKKAPAKKAAAADETTEEKA